MATKILLGLIAAGLWANAVASFVRPSLATSAAVEAAVSSMQMNVAAIANGTCVNRRIC